MLQKKISKKNIIKVITHSPLVAIDLLIRCKKKYLLGLRANEPAKNRLFVPGGRIRKNETLRQARNRIFTAETGILAGSHKFDFKRIGEHFYKNCFFSKKIGTHYVTLCFLVKVKEKKVPKMGQHRRWTWLTKEEILSTATVHPYTKEYFRKGL